MDRLPNRLFAYRPTDFPRVHGTRLFFALLLSRPWARLGILALSILSAGAGILAPYFQKSFLDAFQLNPTLVQGAATKSILAAFASMIVAQILNTVLKVCCSRESAIAQGWLSQQLYEHTLHLKSETQGARTIGETVALYATDVSASCMVLEDVVPSFLNSLIPIIIAPIAISMIYGMPVWPIVLCLAVSLIMCLFLGTRQSRLFAQYKGGSERRLGRVNEWLQNIRVLRIIGWVREFEKRIQKERQAESSARVSMVTNGSTMNSIAQVTPLLFNVVGVSTLVTHRNGQVTPGEIFALLWILGVFLARPVRTIPWNFVNTLDSLTSVRRLERFFRAHTEPDEGNRSPALVAKKSDVKEAAPKVRVEGLTLCASGKPLLDNISFSIEPGEFVAVVGSVGSGKSLLLQSLLRDTEATFSAYKLGDNDAQSFSLAELRAFFSYVPQDGFVMSSTLRDNVTFEYDSPRSKDSEILRSLECAQFSSDLQQLESGLDTEIGERGVNLSGGQKQRVSLARAHFNARPGVLLDDALSAVDPDTEARLADTLFAKEWFGRTRILVTHRLSVLPQVDRILFLERGRLTASGTFQELSETCPAFVEFVRSVHSASSTVEL